MKNSGQSLVEYALLLVLVAMVVIGVVALTGDTLSTVFDRVANDLGQNDSPMETPQVTPIPNDVQVLVALEPETPLGDVQVDAFDESENLVKTTRTNASGEATIKDLVEGRYVFRATYGGQSYWSETINVPKQTSAQISIHEQSFNVHVMNSQGTALADVPVYAFNASKAYSGIEGVTDQNGMVKFDLPDGSYTFRADYSAQATWSEIVTTPDRSSVDVRVPISPISIRVYRSDGKAVKNVEVYAFNANDDYSGIYSTTDKDGTAIMELPDGQYKFRADYKGEAFWSDLVTTPDVNSTEVYVGGFDVTVQVTDTSGNDLSNLTVYVYNSDGEYLNIGKKTDKNGEVVFELNKGSYLFQAIGEDEQDYWSDSVDVSAATSTTIRIQRGGFVVTVTDRNNISGQRIAVYVYKYPSYQYAGMGQYIDQNGQAVFDLGKGKYIFLAYNFTRGNYTWSDDVKVPSQQSITVSIP